VSDITKTAKHQPSSFFGTPPSVGLRQAEGALGEKAQNEIGGNRRNLIEAGFAELALDIILLRKPEAAMGLQACFSRLP
jgi:hypothetical protein